jgi:uncharacterized protein
MAHRRHTLGAIVWPYQCLSWDIGTRLGKICEHCSVLEDIGGPINFPIDDQLVLLDLSEIREGLRVIVDQPEWFMREGQLVINLFLKEVRIYSLAFSLSYREGKIIAFIGALQGTDFQGGLDLYRELTKAFYGLRPRDLLLELFDMLCKRLGVKEILAVSDSHRHHRSAYFGTEPRLFSVNYDEIWTDRGGTRVDPTCYRLQLGQRRDLDSLPSKKRSMYKRRYELLSLLRQRLNDSYLSS